MFCKTQISKKQNLYSKVHFSLTKTLSLDPPTLDPPTLDPPTLDPPTLDPPTLDPPTLDPSMTGI